MSLSIKLTISQLVLLGVSW